jgi:hypothetical protein
MPDPRSPEILAERPLAERLTIMQAMAFAFPILKNDREWNVRLDALLAELKPTARERENILMEAGKMSARLKRELDDDEDDGQVALDFERAISKTPLSSYVRRQ